MPTTARSGKPRPRAIVLAERGEPPVKLSAPQKKLLSEALRRGEDLREQVEGNVTSFGRWLLGSVFEDDPAAALDDKTDNPVWRELVRRAGGPTLKVSRHLLYSSLQLAARDKRITDQTWRGLDAGRKEILLPLGQDDRLREGARHVAKFNLTQASTRDYVHELLKAEGKPRVLRLTVPRIVSRVQKLRAALGGASVLRKVADLRDVVDQSERTRAADEIERLQSVLTVLARALRGKR